MQTPKLDALVDYAKRAYHKLAEDCVSGYTKLVGNSALVLLGVLALALDGTAGWVKHGLFACVGAYYFVREELVQEFVIVSSVGLAQSMPLVAVILPLTNMLTTLSGKPSIGWLLFNVVSHVLVATESMWALVLVLLLQAQVFRKQHEGLVVGNTISISRAISFLCILVGIFYKSVLNINMWFSWPAMLASMDHKMVHDKPGQLITLLPRNILLFLVGSLPVLTPAQPIILFGVILSSFGGDSSMNSFMARNFVTPEPLPQIRRINRGGSVQEAPASVRAPSREADIPDLKEMIRSAGLPPSMLKPAKLKKLAKMMQKAQNKN